MPSESCGALATLLCWITRNTQSARFVTPPEVAFYVSISCCSVLRGNTQTFFQGLMVDWSQGALVVGVVLLFFGGDVVRTFNSILPSQVGFCIHVLCVCVCVCAVCATALWRA